MARPIYVVKSSLDGYVADETGSFAPDEELHVFVNDVMWRSGRSFWVAGSTRCCASGVR
jgi:hypothetical protein